VSDLAIDSSGALDTDEQTHAIEIKGPVDTVSISHIRFNHPRPADGSRSGDCLRMDGELDQLVKNVRVVDATFAACARSGVGIQDGVYGIQVEDSTFLSVGKTDIDAEPTSTGGDANLSIIGNLFQDVGSTSGTAVAIGGFSTPMDHVVVSNNIFRARGIRTYRVSNTTITGNVIEGGYGRIIDVENRADQMVIAGNIIHELPNSPSGPVIYIGHHSGGTASRVVVSHNVITNDNAAEAIHLESVRDVSIVDNDINVTVPATAFMAINMRSTIAPAEVIMISNNRIRGALAAAVYLAASPFTMGRVSIVGNQSAGTMASVRCAGGMFTKPIVHAANNWDGATGCPGVLFVAQLP
jgi:hypothetical protein